MPESTELTTRDVLSQIDRRLTRVEDDLREFRQYVEQRFTELEARFDAKLAAMESRFDAKLGAMESRFEARFSALEAKVDRNFRWQLGISLMLWLSVMTKLFTM